MQNNKVLFLGIISSIWGASYGMEEKNDILTLFEPSFYFDAVNNYSDYDVVVSHHHKEIFRVDSKQEVRETFKIPLCRVDVPSINQTMYKIEDLHIKPEQKKGFYVSLYFCTILSHESPCITSITNLYGLKNNDTILQSRTLDEDIFLGSNVPNTEDIYTIGATLYLEGKQLRRSRFAITHRFEPILQPSVD